MTKTEDWIWAGLALLILGLEVFLLIRDIRRYRAEQRLWQEWLDKQRRGSR